MIQARKLTPGLSSYSTTERDTGITWEDGKNIYRKTIIFASLSNSSSVSARHNISGLAEIIEITGTSCQSGGRWRTLNMPAGNDPGQWTIVEVDGTNVYVYSGNNQTNQSAKITLYYTKN